jgi:hypothetical protein
MRAVKRKITDMTFEIMADSKLMAQIRQVDLDRAAGKKGAFVVWDDLKNA